MAKETAQPAVGADTKWESFEKAGLVPEDIKCQAYLPVHPADMSCHTRLVLTAKAIQDHIAADHGGGFRFTLRKHPKPWVGWKDLKSAGIECHDLRCEVCNARVPMQQRHLALHMKNHQGKNRRITSSGVFWLTLGTDKPVVDEIDAIESDE